MKINTIILAAGQGTRMRSNKPKVIHHIAGKALLRHVYDTSAEIIDNDITIVYGHGGDQVQEEMAGLSCHWTEQKQQLGTGHAVQQAQEYIDDDATVLILYGDVPLLTRQSIDNLLAKVTDVSMALLTLHLDDPHGYGRIVRNQNEQVTRIVEEKDADSEIKKICEVNSGIMALNGGQLKSWLQRLKNDNVQNEYYLTDVIEMAVADGVTVEAVFASCSEEVLGVNNKSQLSYLERVYQKQQAENLMVLGVTLRDPSRFDLRGNIKSIGKDVEIDINVILEGELEIGDNVTIGANTVIKNSKIGDNVTILENCVIEDAVVGQDSRIGPYARLRPGASLADNVHIGNFVEIKKSKVGMGSKVNHLSYIGDSDIGARVNVGAGSITCNYDGVNKFKTTIEDGAFIGSNTQMVAPVTIGANATIGAGSTITKNAPAEQLTLTRSKQITIESWQRPVKKGK